MATNWNIQSACTSLLLSQARAGHSLARKSLAEKLSPLLERIARKLLPAAVGQELKAADLVHETLRRGLSQADFRSDSEAAVVLQLRGILFDILAEHRTTDLPLPVEKEVGAEAWKRYLERLDRLPETVQAAVVLFVECGMEFDEIAELLGYEKADTARIEVANGLSQLTEPSDGGSDAGTE